MSKKTDTKVVKATEPKTPTEAGTGALTWSDWFDHWPELFARRWPETMMTLPLPLPRPFGGDMFRMEHFTDEDGTVVYRFELPGLDPDQDIEVSINEGFMTVEGERRERTKTEDDHVHRSEFRYGSFCRTVRLPAGACADDVAATYRDGILEVRIPVDVEKPAVAHIPITTG